MAAVDELLDKVKESCSLPSDMALATKMGIQRQLLSKARMGDKPLSDERIAQLCAMAKLDGGSWMARIHAERAGTPAERALWRSVLDRAKRRPPPVVALVVLAVHTGAHEAAVVAFSPLVMTDPLYIMRNGTWGHTHPNRQLLRRLDRAKRFQDDRYRLRLTHLTGGQAARCQRAATVQNWESGRTRIPHSAFKLVRLLASGKHLDGPAWKDFQIRVRCADHPRRP
nr:DUF3693 domain-containing protein [Xanthomonas campestris]